MRYAYSLAVYKNPIHSCICKFVKRRYNLHEAVGATFFRANLGITAVMQTNQRNQHLKAFDQALRLGMEAKGSGKKLQSVGPQ
jgi:hypothetical protein